MNHAALHEKLQYFLKCKKIPNIIFHGLPGTGKKTIVDRFLLDIYDNDAAKVKSNTMMVNCSHGKGIKFIRDELKFFAKTNIESNFNAMFKSIVLLNADSLTIDAQSALRRCIELFSKKTRFFIIVENKHKLLNPIVSRFCEIYVPETHGEDGRYINLYRQNIDGRHMREARDGRERERADRDRKRVLDTINLKLEGNVNSDHDDASLIRLSNTIYNEGYSAITVVDNLHMYLHLDEDRINQLKLYFYKLRPEFRCEKMILFLVLKKIVQVSDAK